MTLCANCLTHLVMSGNPDHPWRHADTGFLQCTHGDEVVWAKPEEAEVSA